MLNCCHILLFKNPTNSRLKIEKIFHKFFYISSLSMIKKNIPFSQTNLNYNFAMEIH